MQKELTINLSDETYRGLIKLVGEHNASQFIESILRPYVSESDQEYELTIPLNNGERKVYLRSPRLKYPSDACVLKVEMIEENPNA